MKQTLFIRGDTPEEYVEAYNSTMLELAGYQIEGTREISPLETLVFYEAPDRISEEPDEPADWFRPDYRIGFDGDKDPAGIVRIELVVEDHKGRRCCECDNYDWGVRCPYRSGKVRLMDQACEMFNVTISRRP